MQMCITTFLYRELEEYGHIYMMRFTPQFPMKAYPIDQYPAKTLEGRALMLMICNNLDPAVAQFPQELVTYGGNGQCLSNWAQVGHFLKKYGPFKLVILVL
jgi:urocanate hydratase